MLPAFQSLSTTKECLRIVSGKNPSYPEFMSIYTVKKAECRRIDVFELWCWRRLLRVPCPLDCKEIQPVHPKGDQSWVFIGGTDVEAETPIL